ncbi:MAG: AzlD domain-containing protein [Pseudomonadota bacterium]
MSEATPDLWGLTPLLAIVLAAALPTHMWRWLGVLFAGRLDEQSEIFIFVKAVATALVAALIAKLVIFPNGPLATLPVVVRLGAAALGFAAYLVGGKRLAFGVVTAEVVIVAAWLLTVSDAPEP